MADARTVWLGLEYFCNDGDDLWTKPDAAGLLGITLLSVVLLHPLRKIPVWIDQLIARSYHLETTITYPITSIFDEQLTGGYYLYRRN